MSEGDEGQRLFDISCIRTLTLGCSKTLRNPLLVGAQDFNALAKDHQGLVDIARLFESFAARLRIFASF
jgi:hypothetical protein